MCQTSAMPDFAGGIMNVLQNGPGPLAPQDENKINQWLSHKAHTYQTAGASPEQTQQWLEHDNARYVRHMNELATHAAAAKALEKSKTMLIGMLGLQEQNKAPQPGMSPGDRSAAAYWTEARRNGQVPAGEKGQTAPPWQGDSKKHCTCK